MLILFLMYSILCSEALLQRCLFFFLQPVAGLTNWVLVWDSQAGAPLGLSNFFLGHAGHRSHPLLNWIKWYSSLVPLSEFSHSSLVFPAEHIMAGIQFALYYAYISYLSQIPGHYYVHLMWTTIMIWPMYRQLFLFYPSHWGSPLGALFVNFIKDELIYF